MATTSALMTIDQYLRTSYKPDVDFVEGEIEERNMGERDHSRLQALIVTWFMNREKRFGTFCVVEQRIRVAGSRVRICDVAILSATAPNEAVPRTPPIICIEVMSPEDRISRVEKVLADYLAMGVQNIWLIDPIRRAAYFFSQDGLRVATDNILRVAGTEIALEMDTLFEALDETNA